MANQDSKTSPDRTFEPLSEYSSNAYCASVLGRSHRGGVTRRGGGVKNAARPVYTPLCPARRFIFFESFNYSRA